MAKLTLNDIQGQYASTSELNDNFTLIETAFQNTLSRDGTTPNTMSADLDMNSNDINNVNTVQTTNLLLNGASVTASDLSAVTASQVTNVPAGGIVATDVQAAINELDTEKVPETDFSTFGKTLVDDATAADARTTLGLGAVATESTVPIAKGGTGQTTAQASIDALSQVSAATNEYVLTKDTASGNALWKISAGAELPLNYLSGLTLSNNATDSAHDIDIAVGIARDSTDTYNLELSSTFVKQIDDTWVAGTNQGGLFSGTVAIDTWYHVFLIRKDSDGTIDAGFDTSVTAANIPAGYTAYRRIGSALTDGSGNILPFIQHGNNFAFDTPVADYVSAAPTTKTNLTLSAPLGVRVKARVFAVLFSTATSSKYLIFTEVDGADVAPGINACSVVSSDTSAGYSAGNFVDVWTNESSQVSHRASAANTEQVATHGWYDLRGQE